MKPIIGIIEWPYIDIDEDRIFEVNNHLSEWIIRCGGIPIGIFPTQTVNFYDTKGKDIPDMTENENNDLESVLNMCSGIIKPGATRIYNYERAIYEYAKEKNIPFLGICAGMQMMVTNETGNSIIERNSDNTHYSKEQYVHSINILKNTLLYSILKEEEIMVSSLHNYHINTSGSHEINAYSHDNLIEGIINKDMDFGIGVQWHPENELENDINSQRLFTSFIEHSHDYQRKRIK